MRKKKIEEYLNSIIKDEGLLYDAMRYSLLGGGKRLRVQLAMMASAALGGKEEDIPYLAHTASYGNGNKGTLGSFVVLSEEDIANVYRLAL